MWWRGGSCDRPWGLAPLPLTHGEGCQGPGEALEALVDMPCCALPEQWWPVGADILALATIVQWRMVGAGQDGEK